jgi:hypothetical protein
VLECGQTNPATPIPQNVAKIWCLRELHWQLRSRKPCPVKFGLPELNTNQRTVGGVQQRFPPDTDVEGIFDRRSQASDDHTLGKPISSLVVQRLLWDETPSLGAASTAPNEGARRVSAILDSCTHKRRRSAASHLMFVLHGKVLSIFSVARMLAGMMWRHGGDTGENHEKPVKIEFRKPFIPND